MKKCKKLRLCRVCDSRSINPVINLGSFPIPNGFLKYSDTKKKEDTYPLRVGLCKKCGLVQLLDIVDPDIMFSNYLYIPSTSGPRVEKFKELVARTHKIVPLDDKTLVVDIGSNDGSLLIAYKTMGARTLGIDPAKNLVILAKLNGVETIHGYINPKIAKKVIKTHGYAHVTTATNVMAHIDDLKELIVSLEILLDNEGIFISHFPYLIDLIDKKQFDTIYHEHLSYFSLKPLIELANGSEIEIFDFELSDLDGGSIKIFWKKKKNKSIKVKEKKIQKQLELEESYGCYDTKTYKKFQKDILKLKKDIRKTVREISKSGKTVAGYGASARGNIALNYFGLSNKKIKFIVDSTPYKQGLYTPGTYIPIHDEAKIYETTPDYVLILAWNFKDEIMKKNEKFKKNGGKFIVIDKEVIII